MTTKLDSPVTRRTELVVDGREVDVTMLPADEMYPERFEFHQKGLKTSVEVPMAAVLKAIGWKVSMKLAKLDKSAEMDTMLGNLEVALKPWKQ